jgi:hypothetical protein
VAEEIVLMVRFLSGDSICLAKTTWDEVNNWLAVSRIRYTHPGGTLIIPLGSVQSLEVQHG